MCLCLISFLVTEVNFGIVDRIYLSRIVSWWDFMSLLEQLEMYEGIIVDICTVLKFLLVIVEWSVETSFKQLIN